MQILNELVNQGSQINGQSKKKIELPPISSFMTDLPILVIDLPLQNVIQTISSPHQETDNQYAKTTEQDTSDDNQLKSNPYTIEDDILIINAVANFYGSTFHGKVPWSFWNTLIATKKLTRTNSSLYHHWNGAMMRKYGEFLKTGHLRECIKWLQDSKSEIIKAKSL